MDGRRWLVVLMSATIGVGAALGAGACGEDRGGVDVEGDSTGKTGERTGTGNTTGTGTGATGTGTRTGKTTTGSAPERTTTRKP